MSKKLSEISNPVSRMIERANKKNNLSDAFNPVTRLQKHFANEEKRLSRISNPNYYHDLILKEREPYIKLATKLFEENKPYINATRKALEAINSDLALKDKIVSIRGYQSETEEVLSGGVDAETAQEMEYIHEAIAETVSEWESETEESAETKQEMQELKALIIRQGQELSKLKEELAKTKEKPLSRAKQKKNDLVEWNGKKVKPATKEKYEKWQIDINREFALNHYLSHNAICIRIAKKLKVSPESIRRVTNPPTKKN